MCNEFALEQNLEDLAALFAAVDGLAPFGWAGDQTPNDLAPRASIRISDRAPVVRLSSGRLEGAMTPWAWRAPNGKPVFNFQSEGRDFSQSDRVLIPATGFFEYTAPAAAKVKLKDQHLFTLARRPWFWIAGVVREGAFSLLTTTPGADIAPYHNRQIVVLAPEGGPDWLALSRPAADILRAGPSGMLAVQTLRRDGRVIPAA